MASKTSSRMERAWAATNAERRRRGRTNKAPRDNPSTASRTTGTVFGQGAPLQREPPGGRSDRAAVVTVALVVTVTVALPDVTTDVGFTVQFVAVAAAGSEQLKFTAPVKPLKATTATGYVASCGPALTVRLVCPGVVASSKFGGSVTLNDSAADVLGAKLASPPYAAIIEC